ncbi:MAG: DNA alkylation repair protein [Paramuribaculum sp.]|nr:DNA alkylation repair protein [Paramuribaculum sp.]
MDKYQEIREAFELLASEHKAREMAAYMRNRFKFYGIQTPQRKAAYKQLISTEKKNKAINWELLDRCWEDEHREFQYFVVDYLKALQKFLSYDDVAHIEYFIRTKQWWDTIDGMDRTVGAIAFTDSRINDLMLRWSTDDDFWVRRIAIDHQLLRKDKTDTILLEKIIVNNFGSSEFFINKAIGWSLRDYSKTNPEWVRDFINRHYSKMSALSLREASKYI